MALEPAGLRWVNENLPGFLNGIRDANRAMARMGQESSSAGGKLDILGGVVMGVATGMTTFALNAVAKLGQAMVGLGASGIQLAADFEGMVASLEIAAGAAAEGVQQFGGLGEVALAVGGDTRLLGVSATGAADAMTGLLKSGLSLEDVLGDVNAYMAEGAELGGALRASIDMAAATELDMVQASDLAVTVMSTFGLTAEEVTGAMDHMVRAADASVAEVSGLAEAIAYVGPAAAAMGMSIEDTNAALAVLSMAGIQGSRAGTTLEAMLRDLVKGTDKATKKMDELGISTYDESGAMLPLVDIIAQLEVALEGASQAERDAALAAIFTAQGRRAANIFLDQGTQGWLDMTEAIGGATTMEDMAARRADTFAGKMEAMQGAMETLKIRIGSALLPALTDLIGAFTDIIDEYGPALSGAFEKIGSVLGTVAKAIGGFVRGFTEEGLYIGIENFLDTLGIKPPPGLWDFLNGLLRLLRQLPSIIGTAIDVGRNFFETLRGAGETAGGVLLPILQRVWAWLSENLPAAFATVSDIYRSTLQPALSELGEAFSEVWQALKDAWNEVVPIFSEVVAAFAEAFGSSGGEALSFKDVIVLVTEVVALAIKGWAYYFATMAKVTAKVFKVVGKLWDKHGETILNFVKILGKVAAAVADFVGDIVRFFSDLARKLVGGSIIPDMMDDIRDVIVDVLEAVADFIERVWGEILDTIADFLADILAEVKDKWDDILSAITGFLSDILAEVRDKWSDILNAITDFLADILAEVRDKWDEILSAIAGYLADILSEVSAKWNEILNTITSFLADILSEVKDKWSEILSAIAGYLADILSEVSTKWNEILSTISGYLDDIGSAIETKWSEFLSTISSYLADIGSAIETKWNEFLSTVTRYLDDIGSAIETKWNEFLSTVTRYLDDIGSAIEMKWNEFLSTISGVLGDIIAEVEAWATNLYDSVADAIAALTGIVEDLKDDLIAIGSGIIEKIVEGIQSVTDFASRVAAQLASWIGDIVLNVGGIAATLLSYAATLGAKVVSWIVAGLEAVTSFIGDVRDFIKDALSDLVSNAGGIAASLIGAASSLAGKIIDWIVSGLWALVGSFAQRIADFISSALSQAFSPIPEAQALGKKLAEQAVVGLAKARKILAEGIGVQLSSVIQPMLTASPAILAPVMAPAPVAAGGTTTITIGPNYVSDEMDMAVFEARVKQVVSEEF